MRDKLTGMPCAHDTPPPAIGRRRAVPAVAAATVLAAGSGYLVLLLAAHQLGAAGYAAFAAFWAAYGMVTGAQNGQLQETTRAVRTRLGLADVSNTTGQARPLNVNVIIGIGLAVFVAASAPLWAPHALAADRGLSVLLLAVGVASFAVYAHLAGALSGATAWGPFATLLGIDALLRAVGAVVAVAVGWSLSAFLVVTVIGSLSWGVLLLASPTARRVVGLRGDRDRRALTVNTLTAMAAAAASAVVVMGFPVLMQLTARATDDPALLGATMLAVTLTRAPLLVPLNSFQGVLIARFAAAPAQAITLLRAPIAAVGAAGVLGVLAAWAVGPWLLSSVFGDDFRLGGPTLAALTAGAGTLAALTVTGAATIAVGAHRAYAAGWWLAAAATTALLLMPLAVDMRVAVALAAGPVIGAIPHLVSLARIPPRTAPPRAAA